MSYDIFPHEQLTFDYEDLVLYKKITDRIKYVAAKLAGKDPYGDPLVEIEPDEYGDVSVSWDESSCGCCYDSRYLDFNIDDFCKGSLKETDAAIEEYQRKKEEEERKKKEEAKKKEEERKMILNKKLTEDEKALYQKLKAKYEG